MKIFVQWELAIENTKNIKSNYNIYNNTIYIVINMHMYKPKYIKGH